LDLPEPRGSALKDTMFARQIRVQDKKCESGSIASLRFKKETVRAEMQ
jgi:hypothetical protein